MRKYLVRGMKQVTQRWPPFNIFLPREFLHTFFTSSMEYLLPVRSHPRNGFPDLPNYTCTPDLRITPINRKVQAIPGHDDTHMACVVVAALTATITI
jgi:hypothetical protein